MPPWAKSEPPWKPPQSAGYADGWGEPITSPEHPITRQEPEREGEARTGGRSRRLPQSRASLVAGNRQSRAIFGSDGRLGGVRRSAVRCEEQRESRFPSADVTGRSHALDTPAKRASSGLSDLWDLPAYIPEYIPRPGQGRVDAEVKPGMPFQAGRARPPVDPGQPPPSISAGDGRAGAGRLVTFHHVRTQLWLPTHLHHGVGTYPARLCRAAGAALATVWPSALPL